MKTTYIVCKNCKHTTNKAKNTCDRCGIVREDFIVGDSAAIHVFRAGFYEHIDLEPIYCGSKAELRAQTEDRGLTSHYVH